MIADKMKNMVANSSAIRAMFEEGNRLAGIYGAENVFDFSLGNPSVPTVQEYQDEIVRLHTEENPMNVHGYSPSLGIESVRQAVADSLNKRFDMDYQAKHIFMTSAAASALAHAFRATTKPGDEILTFAPYFPEYNPYVNHTGAKLRVVPADTADFQINFDAFEEMMNEKVMAVLINTPNNPFLLLILQEPVSSG